MKPSAETMRDPAKKTEWIFGQSMNPCPKCGSYNMKHQVPIQMDVPDEFDAKKLLGAWARARKEGRTTLLGTAYMICWDCGHKGPSVDVSGRTAEDVGKDPIVAKKIKQLWNEQRS